MKTAEVVVASGAHGVTIHPRPDERHIRKTDVYDLADFVKAHSHIEYNIEGYPSADFIEMVCSVPCHQVTLVPDAPDQKTSDHGWDVAKHFDFLKGVVAKIQSSGPRVSLFIDPVPRMAQLAAEVGAKRVELYTGPYFEGTIAVEEYSKAAEEAVRCGLMVNAGHDLNLDNLNRFVKAVPQCAEVSIGHAITADALMMGWDAAIKAYLGCLR